MMTEAKTFTPQEFRARLKDSQASSTTFLPPLTAFIRDSEQGEDFFQVSLQSCQSWIEVPHSLIDQIEHLRDGRCGDHSHPIVVLHFKPVQNPEIRALLALLAGVSKATSEQQAAAQNRSTAQGSGERSRSVQPEGVGVSAGRTGAWWCVLPDFLLTDCLPCLNGCQELGNPVQREKCIKNCCC